ncbi:DUF4328 domain-containing protein [Streptomyces sp. NPDC005722]
MTHDGAVIISPPARPPRGEPDLVPRATTVVVVAALGVRVPVNAEAPAPGGHRMQRGWTTGAWLIPPAGFVLPKRIINDIWAAGLPPGRPRRTSVLLTSWWLLFVAAQLLASPIATGDPAAAETAGAALRVLAGALCIGVVLRIASMQRTRLRGWDRQAVRRRGTGGGHRRRRGAVRLR